MLRVENLSKFYPGGVKALFPANLDFHSGEFTVLLGPSGAGKSTLLRCLNLLTTPYTGKITSAQLGEIDSPRAIRAHRRQTGMIFQQHQLIPRYSALDNVLMGRAGYHSFLRSLFPLPQKDQMFALACLERVGLIHKALDRVDTLSGGEQQRVGIARALAQQPKLILADEPVASLDPATAEHVLLMLHRICKEENLTAIVSLHQIHLARIYADRVIGLSQGHVVFDGKLEKLTQQVLDTIYSKDRQPQARSDDAFSLLTELPVPAFSSNQQGY